MKNIQLKYHEIVNDLLLLRWSDNTENILSLKSMRDNCPCANCSGETDVFGNVYKGPPQSMNSSYKLKEYILWVIMHFVLFGMMDIAMEYILLIFYESYAFALND